MHQGKYLPTSSIGATLLVAVVWGSTVAAQTTNLTSGQILKPAVWQGPEFSSQPGTSGTPSAQAPILVDASQANDNPLRVALQVSPPLPPQTTIPTIGVPVPAAEPRTLVPPAAPPGATLTQPLLDGSSPTEDLMPPVVEGGCYGAEEQTHVRPYGGGHPTDWSWGCGGSPYRTGPGMCDNYKVGPRWHWTFDGLVMSRDETDLVALEARMRANDPTGTQIGTAPPPPILFLTPATEQFDYGPGGRLTITSEVPRYVGYQIQMAYEGINNWDAGIVFPKLPLPPAPGLPVPGSPTPPDPLDLATEQRSLQYSTNYNSGEISWVRSCDDNWHPFCGFRFMRINDRISDFLDQQAPPPLPQQLGPGAILVPPVPPALPFVTTTDRINLFKVQNNLMGFQLGMLHEAWCINQRFTIEGFANAGVYYNHVNYLNKMGTFTTQQVGDNLDTPADDESQTNFSNTVNNDKRDFAEISYSGEASISGVCRLNKCWALRAGYQVLWINQLHLADAAFLGDENSTDDLLFHGWHAGIECRR